MDFEQLVELGMNKATSVYSDDGSMPERATRKLLDALATQDVYTLSDIEDEVRMRMNELVRQINERFENA